MEKKNKYRQIGGVVFAGCMFLGAGIGMMLGSVAPGVMIGMGVGFIGMAIVMSRSKNEE